MYRQSAASSGRNSARGMYTFLRLNFVTAQGKPAYFFRTEMLLTKYLNSLSHVEKRLITAMLSVHHFMFILNLLIAVFPTFDADNFGPSSVSLNIGAGTMSNFPN